MKTINIMILAITFAVIFSGCVGERKQIVPTSTPGVEAGIDTTPIPFETPRVEKPQRIFDEAKDVTDIAKQDLATKLNINVNDVKVDAVVPVEWADKSLGYPEEGKTYELNTTQGYVIFLLANEKFYEYHSDRTKVIVPPERPIEGVENMEKMPRVITNNSAYMIIKLIDMARIDISERLNISIDSIQLVRVVPMEWPDTSLGYPEEGKAYAQVITPGLRIVLGVGSTLYEYHSDTERVIAPPDLPEGNRRRQEN